MHRNYSTQQRLKGSCDKKQLVFRPNLAGADSLNSLVGKTYGGCYVHLGEGRFASFVTNSLDSQQKARLLAFLICLPGVPSFGESPFSIIGLISSKMHHFA